MTTSVQEDGAAETSPPPSSADAAGDADAAADAGPTDANGDEAEADVVPPPPLLDCTVGVGPPRVLENESAAPEGYERLAVARTSKGARIIASRRGVTGFLVVTYEIGGGASSVGVAAGETVLQIQRFADAIAVLTWKGDGSGGSSGIVKLWTITDMDTVDEKELSMNVTQPPAGGTISGGFVRLGMNDHFFALAYGDAMNPGNNLIAVGRQIGNSPVDISNAVVARNLVSARGRISAVAYAGTRAYVFDDTAGGTWFYDVPGTAIVTAPIPKSNVGAAAGRSAAVVATGAGASSTTFAAAVASFDFGAPVPLIVHVGDVPSAKLNPTPAAFAAEDIANAVPFASFDDSPIGSKASVFSGTDFLALGQASGPGVNFLWYDTKARAVRARRGAANRLLADRDLQGGDVFAIALKSQTSTTAQLDLVWAERASGDAGAARQLLAIDVNCIP